MNELRLEVVSALGDDGAAISAAAGGAVVAVGVPVIEAPAGPTLASDVPASLSIGDVEVPLALRPEQCRQRGFAGKPGEINVVAGAAGLPTLVYVGCGPLHALDLDGLRRAAALFVRAAGRSGTGVFVLPASMAERATGAEPGDDGVHRAAQAVAEGAALAAYRFDAHKSSADAGALERVVVVGAGVAPATTAEAVRRGTRVATAVSLARDLVNEPPSSMTPTALAEIALSELGAQPGVTVEVWDEQRITDERLGGLLGVARGSAQPPRLVRATYEPPGRHGADVTATAALPHIVLVGKGITFDSGGLSLKSPEGMMTMKTDMSGAASVLATLWLCADLGVHVRVTAIAPVTENMPGGKAIKPGDVLTIRSGRTIEVLNTDAEGRLVLADGLTLAAEMQPDAIVDAATLTGAQVTALGMLVAAVFGNDDDLVQRVLAASARAGEPMWQLPLVERYNNHIDSDVADMKNIGKSGQAGSISAALLLARFVGDIPWVHIDMAGPARAEENDGYVSKGGTGFAVRTLLELVSSYESSGT